MGHPRTALTKEGAALNCPKSQMGAGEEAPPLREAIPKYIGSFGLAFIVQLDILITCLVIT